MKNVNVVMALSLALVAGTAHAEPLDEPIVIVPARLVPAVLEPAQQLRLRSVLEDREHKAARLRNAGIGLTVGGSILTFVAAGLMSVGLCFDSCNGNHDGELIAGSISLALGQAGVLIGIPMWAVGQSSKSSAEAMRLSFTPGGLAGRF